MPRAVVFGGSGFIGCHLVMELARRDYDLVSFDREPSPISGRLRGPEWGHAPLKSGPAAIGRPGTGLIDPLAYYPKVREVIGDFFYEGDLADVLRPGDICFHLVSTSLPAKSNSDPYADAQNNICGALRFFDAAARRGVAKVVFISSGGTVYGRPRQLPISESHPTEPTCAYGIAKLAVEKYLALYTQLHKMGAVCLRLANPYGPLQKTEAVQGAIAVFMGKARRGEEIEIWGDGGIIRDYIYIQDAVRAVVAAAEEEEEEETGFRLYNVGSGRGRSLNEIIQAIAFVSGLKLNVKYSAARAFDVPANVLDISLAEKRLGWRPTVPLEEGLARTWAALTSEKL